MFKKNRIREGVAIFVEYPKLCEYKTIEQKLEEKGALRVYQLMVENTISKVSELRAIKPDLQIVIYHDESDDQRIRYWLARKFHSDKLTFRPHTVTAIGDRIRNAFLDCFHDGIERTLVVGCDFIGIRDNILEDAFGILKWDDCDMALGPADNGWYYLIGANRRIGNHVIESLFKAIDWRTKNELNQQVEAAEFAGVKLGKLEQKLKAVIGPEDIEAFEQEVSIRSVEMTAPTWSVIIPIADDVNSIGQCLENVLRNFSQPTQLQIVICDGGSSDGSIDKVREIMEGKINWKVICAPQGRGRQMIAGASESSGHNLLFLDVDTRLPKNYDAYAEECLWTPGNVAGCFQFAVNSPDGEGDKDAQFNTYAKIHMKVVEWGTNLRSKYGEAPHTDQAIFIRKKTYLHLGGLSGYTFAEDFGLIDKLKDHGHIGVVENAPCLMSPSKVESKSYLRSTGKKAFLMAAVKFGVSPDKLPSWSFGDKRSDQTTNGRRESADELSATPTTSEAGDLLEPVKTPPY